MLGLLDGYVNPRPRISSLSIILTGLFLHRLAVLYPTSLLVITAVLAVLVPYSLRENDDALSRRRLWNDFIKNKNNEQRHPKEVYCDDVICQEAYWINERGMALLTSTMMPKLSVSAVPAVPTATTTKTTTAAKKSSQSTLSIDNNSNSNNNNIDNDDNGAKEGGVRRRRRNGGTSKSNSNSNNTPTIDGADVITNNNNNNNNNNDIRAVVYLCHGYMDNISYLKRIQFQRFCKQANNIAVVMIEYEGHGRSDGLSLLLPKWEYLIQDCHDYFTYITATKFPNVKYKFLLGESMGGAVVYDIITQYPQCYTGVIFVAPMVKILVTPSPWVVSLFELLVGNSSGDSSNSDSSDSNGGGFGSTIQNWICTLPYAPSKGDMPQLSFKDIQKMKLALSVPTRYGRKPRLGTARELLNATKRISQSLSKYDIASLLVVHGSKDMVTDVNMSRLLYSECPSNDKQLIVYEDMYHNLTCGETDENIQLVFNDIIQWIIDRS
jgi:alpha-beta hydrolase superfamily lysophospholipase